jgi:DNA polymerase-3 subunit beta
MDKNNLLNTVRAAGIFSSRLSEVTLGVKSAEGIVEVKSQSSETGEYHATYPAKVTGGNVEANFNYHYLLEALQSVPSAKIFLGFNGPQKAVLVKGADNSDYIHLVMPMRGI